MPEEAPYLRTETASTAKWRTNLPWIDATAALSAGILMLVLCPIVSQFYALPSEFLTLNGVVSVLYSAIGWTLGARRPRSASLLYFLIAANATWAVFCLASAAQFASRASVFGLAHLVLEAAFVSALAAVEWRHRRAILDVPRAA